MKSFKKFLGLLLAFAMMIPTGVNAASESKTVKIIYTNDVHTYIDKDFSYATVSQLKKDLAAEGNTVFLVDAGDHAQGTAYGGMDNGKTMINLMNAAGYDLATFGNHEFDYGMETALSYIDQANFPYVSCNFKDLRTNSTVVKPYEVFTAGDIKIAFVGVTTPETFTKSTPAYFQDENGNYIYDISSASIYADVQTAVDAAKAEADYVIALGHLGIDPESTPYRSTDVIANVTGLDAWIDGHSHNSVEMETVKDKAGKNVVLTQTGSYFATIGQMTIEDGKITTELRTDYKESDPAVQAQQDAWKNEVNALLGSPIAESDIEFRVADANGQRMVRKAETNMGNLNSDAYYYYINKVANLNCDVAIANGGGVRAAVPAGIWTYNETKTVNPFGNVLCLMEITGQQLLDALEWGAQNAPVGESGGFLHASGVIYEVNGNMPNTTQKDDKGVWTAGPSEYRVHNVKVYNKTTGTYEPLDLTKTYAIGGNNYTLRQLGDGFAMFDGANLVMEGIAEDYLGFAGYLQAFEDTDGNGLPNISSETSPLKEYKGFILNYETALPTDRIQVEYVTVNGELEATVNDNGQSMSSLTIDFGKEVSNLDKDTFTVHGFGTVGDLIEGTDNISYGEYDKDITIAKVEVNGTKATLYFNLTEGTTLSYLSAAARNYPVDLTYTVKQNKAVTLAGEETWINVAVNASKYTDPETAKFESVIVEDGINYQLYVPENPTSLVVWFHGNGEGDYLSSNNNVAQMLANRGTVAWATDEAQEIFGNAVVMAFQAPDTWYYAQRDGLLAKAHDEIMEVVKANGIDPEKIAVSGCSAGGYMTTRMIIAYPDLFAAAMINCPALDVADARGGETPTDEELATIKDSRTAIWLVQGEDDQTVKTAECSQRLFNILTEGQELVTTEVKGFAGIASPFTTTETKDGKYLLSIYEQSEDGNNQLMFAEDYNVDGELELVQYSNHWSWIYTLRNNPENAEGTHIWQWAASKLVKEETPVTPDQPGTEGGTTGGNTTGGTTTNPSKPNVGIYNNVAYAAIATVALAGGAYVAFKKKED